MSGIQIQLFLGVFADAVGLANLANAAFFLFFDERVG